MDSLIELLKKPYEASTWPEESNSAFESLFGSSGGRYEKRAQKEIQFRTPSFKSDKGVPFSAIIHESNPTSGGYGGMSFVIFPIEDGPSMIAMVIGTQGLSPDEHIIGKPGHSRKMNAITKWLNSENKGAKQVAWAKREAVRTDISVPDNVRKEYSNYKNIFDRYGDVIYGFCITEDRSILEKALKVFLDFHFDERGFRTLTNFEGEVQQIQSKYFNYLMPTVEKKNLLELLKTRKYVILQGPPGTGKTRLANKLLKEEYKGNGNVIQFHPNTTYENFVGGLFPVTSEQEFGLKFQVKRGHLLDAVDTANKSHEDVLLIIDEINRADLSKVLGEAIYGLEPYEERTIKLPYDFGHPIGTQMSIPQNLHILGTMNTADRSIAILDVAIRRRFAFVNMWPYTDVVEKNGNDITKNAFQKLLGIFVEYAPDESFSLMPGHSYFIAHDNVNAATQMKTNLIPLLQEYLSQGYVSNFADSIHAYIQEIEQL